MDILKAQLARLQEQLSGLTASQKMLSAALVAIMAMTLIWWGMYAGQAEMTPLLDQSFSADDIAQITPRLDAKGIRYTVSVDKILVPSDRKIEALADLSFNRLLPHKKNGAFEDILTKMTPWDPADKTAQLWVEVTQRELSEIIGGYPSVRDANVIIDRTSERRLDGEDVVPTAMVNITTDRSGDSDGPAVNVRRIAISAADSVAAAVAGLSPGHVSVVIDGVKVPVPDSGAPGAMPDGDSVVEAKLSAEKMYQQKVLDLLAYINGRVFVIVNAELSTKAVQTQVTKYDPKGSAQLPLTTEEHDTDTTTPGNSAPAEPGAGGNLTTNGTLAVGGGGGGGGNGGTSTETETKQTNEVRIGQTIETTSQGPGDAPAVSAAVRIPRSYFVNTYKDHHPGGADPDEAALTAWRTDEASSIQRDVMNCLGIKTPDTVVVNEWDDGGQAAAATAAPLAPAAGGSPVTMILQSHAKEMGVGALAVVSLFMVMMMVRKSGGTPLPVEPVEEVDEGPTNRLKEDSDVAGEVREQRQTMDGMELDDEAVKTQQVVEQVSNLVAENPDAAANLVKRWLNRT